MARAEPPPPPLKVEPNARGTRVLRGLTSQQLARVDVYKLENLIGGKGGIMRKQAQTEQRQE